MGEESSEPAVQEPLAFAGLKEAATFHQRKLERR